MNSILGNKLGEECEYDTCLLDFKREKLKNLNSKKLCEYMSTNSLSTSNRLFYLQLTKKEESSTANNNKSELDITRSVNPNFLPKDSSSVLFKPIKGSRANTTDTDSTESGSMYDADNSSSVSVAMKEFRKSSTKRGTPAKRQRVDSELYSSEYSSESENSTTDGGTIIYEKKASKHKKKSPVVVRGGAKASSGDRRGKKNWFSYNL